MDYNPYNPYSGVGYPINSWGSRTAPTPSPAPNSLPPQQVLQVNGKASVDMLVMSPNSSLLAMDTTASIVWLCVSDGIGRVTATPYDISEHQEPIPTVPDYESRFDSIEKTLKELVERMSANESHAPSAKRS